MKRIVIATITISLLFLLFSCDESLAPGEKYHFTFTMGWDASQGAIPPSKAPNDPHFQYVDNKLGIAPLTQPYDWKGGSGYEESVRLQISGGDIPEALQLYSTSFVQELINSKTLIPLDDLLPKYAPNIWKLFTQEQWDLVRSFSPDGKIYFVPLIQKIPRVGLIRVDWLREVGINKVPETKEELLAAYRAFKTKDANGNGDPNDEIPVSGRESMRWCDDLFVMHGVSMIEGWPDWKWDEKTQAMVSHQVSNEMKNSVIFIRQLMEEKLMDPMMPILQGADWFTKIENDTVGHYFHVTSGLPRRLAMRTSGKNPDAEWVYMPNVKVEGVPHQKNYAPGMGANVGITFKAIHPGLILKWLDWGMTSEGQKFIALGIEGLNYKEINGVVSYPEGTTPVSNKHVYAMPTLDRQQADALASLPYSDQIMRIYNASRDDVQYVPTNMMPGSVYEGYEDYNPARAALYREKVGKMVLGELPMSAWDDYVKEWYQKGGTEVTKRVTEWYKNTYINK